jgi:diguanylate cyclase (GGDEF)-like protein
MFRKYLRNSIRFRALCCLLASVAVGVVMAWFSDLVLTTLKLLPFQPDPRLGLILFLSLTYTVLLLMLQVPVMLQPIGRLSQRLRQVKSRSQIRQLDRAEFAELAPLLDTVMEFMEWAEKQQHVASAIHQAFHKKIEIMAEYDGLTGLYNYHYLTTVLPHQIALAANANEPLSVIMLDLDHFDRYNERNDREEGDKVLTQVAEILRQQIRKKDICARYGGEEFFLALPNADVERAYAIAERIRKAIEQTAFPGGELQPTGQLTASLGVAGYPAEAKTADALIKRAELALDQAKQAGRNRTSTYDDDLAGDESDLDPA